MSNEVQNIIPSLETVGNMSDEAVLVLTRQLRIEAIRDLHKNGSLSGENSDRNLFVSMINGLDSQAINNKKIASEQKSNASNAALVAEIVARITPADFGVGRGIPVDVTTKVLPMGLTDAVLVPGETDVNPPQLDYNSFVAANERVVPADQSSE